MAGKRLGLLDQPLVHQAVADLARGRDTREKLLESCRDERSLLAAEPMRYLHALNSVGEPDWVAMEEVPDVLALWRQYAAILRSWGFSVWTGILNAADYGVPQTRRRAILLASRTQTAQPPRPRTRERPNRSLPVLWVAPLDHPERLLTAAVAVGVVLLALAHVAGIVNRWREGSPARALYAVSGIAGSALFLGLAGLAAGGYLHHTLLTLTGAVVAAGGLVLAASGLFAASGGGVPGAP